MSDQLPDPLVPPEVDLNGFGFMPILHHRVLQSTLFIKSTGDEFKAAFALWCASWSEVPAATLPDDDEILEALSRSKTWKKVKTRAMHGWFKCSDGRLHHAILAPLALDAWERREEFREVRANTESRQERWRARVKELTTQLRALGITPPRKAGLEKLETLLRDAHASTNETVVDGGVDACRDGAVMPLTETETETETLTVRETSRRDVGTHAALLSKRIRQEGLFTSVSPSDQGLRGLIEAGYADDLIVDVSREAAEKQVRSFSWIVTAVQSRAQKAGQIKPAPATKEAKPWEGAI